MSYQYDGEFFDFVEASAGRSASLFIKTFIHSGFDGSCPSSVLDVGCGRGIWLASWAASGVERMLGVDGDYVPRDTLVIPKEHFRAIDISKPFDLNDRFDLVQCLEVAEHVPTESADTLIGNLCRHGDVILFSAAIPGQGGEFHVNEQPYEYWRAKFAARGYTTVDFVRAPVRRIREIEPWYRFNTFVFVNELGMKRLGTAARQAAVPTTEALMNLAPLPWRLRCFVLSLLPSGAVSSLARLKHRVANALRPTTTRR